MLKIVAEAGVNHNGSLETAIDMIKAAKNSGADAIKFQTFKAENVVVGNAKQAPYQIKNTGKEETQRSMLKKLELTFDDFLILSKECKKRNIEFISTAFDVESINFLHKNIDQKLFKISSPDLINYFILRSVGKTMKPVYLSTGMGNLNEIKDAIRCLYDFGTPYKKITLLHCNSEYPTPSEDVNISAILTLKNKFDLPVGFSDHSIGNIASSMAIALGATVIEKHFTLSKKMIGPDHKASLDIIELKDFVLSLRESYKMYGNSLKEITPSEKKNINIVRRSLVARKKINIGDKFSFDNVTAKRPSNGISPMKFPTILGNLSKRNYSKDDLIEN